MLKVIIPSYKFRGETAVLECQYQLNGRQHHSHPSIMDVLDEDTLERVASSRHQGSIVNSYHNETNDHQYDNNYLYNNNRDENNHHYHHDADNSHEDTSSGGGSDPSNNEKDFFTHNRHHEKGSRNNHNVNSRHRLHKHHSSGVGSSTSSSSSSISGGSEPNGMGRTYIEQQNNDGEQEEEEALYSVKWYRDNEEFYRYVPKDNPPQHSYNVDGIKVDVSSGSVLLF